MTVTLTDRLGTRITNASGVDVRLTYLDADLGEGLLSSERSGEGEYLATKVPINIAGPYQLEVAVRRPDTFDARTAFRFEVASGGGVSSSTIYPSADTGRLLFGIELAVLGFMLLAVGIPLGGWYSRRGLAVMTPGLAVFMIGAGIVFTAQFGDTGTSGDRSPFPPNPESLTIGSRVYTETCASCHGDQGLWRRSRCCRSRPPARQSHRPRAAPSRQDALRIHTRRHRRDGHGRSRRYVYQRRDLACNQLHQDVRIGREFPRASGSCRSET